MSKEVNEELGYFVYGVHMLRRSDSKVLYEDNYLNNRVPIEVVIMQLKIFLKKLEKDYFDEHSNKSGEE